MQALSDEIGSPAPLCQAVRAAQTHSTTDHSSISSATRLFLASRDVPCPRCRRRLEAGDRCSRCGEELVLGLAGERSPWVPPLFMLAVFGWILIAGAMNFTRDGVPLVRDLARGQTVNWYVTFPDGDFWVGGETLRDYTPMGRSLKDPANKITKVVRRDWSPITRLTFYEKLIVLWEVVMMVGGLVGLGLLGLHYRRAFSRRGWVFARIWTYIIFGCYASMHVYSFVREWI